MGSGILNFQLDPSKTVCSSFFRKSTALTLLHPSIYGVACLLAGIIVRFIKTGSPADSRAGKALALFIGLLILGKIQTQILFFLIQVLKVSLIVDVYTGLSYFFAYFTMTSVIGLLVFSFVRLRTIFDNLSKTPHTSLMSPSDVWLQKKYEMIFDGFKESRKTTFFFTYWIVAFNVASSSLAGWVVFYGIMVNAAVNLLVGIGELVLQVFSTIKKWLRIGQKSHNKPKTTTKLFIRANSLSGRTQMEKARPSSGITPDIEIQNKPADGASFLGNNESARSPMITKSYNLKQLGVLRMIDKKKRRDLGLIAQSVKFYSIVNRMDATPSHAFIDALGNDRKVYSKRVNFIQEYKSNISNNP